MKKYQSLKGSTEYNHLSPFMSPIKICMISYHTCPLASEEGKETGGMNVYVLELAKQLANLGHQVDIFTRCQDVTNPRIVEIGPGLRLMHIAAGPAGNIPKKDLIQFIPEFVANVAEFCKASSLTYDVMHCHYYMSGIAGKHLQKMLAHPGKKLPIISTFHTLALMKNLVARSEMETEGTVRIDAELEMVRTSDAIVAPSESDASYLKYLYEADIEKVHIIPPGVDVTVFHPIAKKEARKFVDAKPKDKIVMFVGRIEPLKGIDMLMYAMKIVSHNDPKLPLKLYIVGGDISQDISLWSAELKKLEKLRKVLRIPDIVHFVGQKPQHELAYYYNAADIVVMPSHYESFGMAALEAMTCGVPVITTNVAGISGLIDERKKALLTSVNNPLLLASQIEYLLTHPRTHAQISSEVKTKVHALEWKNVAQKVASVYKLCLKNS
jgi:D-inositol-3-phosphate glycosyltransferase